MTRELIIECMVCNEECQEENSCFECADKQLTEYEKQIRTEAIDECIEALGNNIWDIAKLEQLKGQKLCSNRKPCKHPKCNKCGTTHFMSECDYGKE